MKDFFELRENKIFFVKVGDGRDSMTVKTKAPNSREAVKKLKSKYPKERVSLDQNQKQGQPAGALESVEEAYRKPTAAEIAADKAKERRASGNKSPDSSARYKNIKKKMYGNAMGGLKKEEAELTESPDLMKMSKELLKHKSKGVNYEKAAAYVRAIHNNSNVNVQDKAMKGLLDLLKNMDLTDRTTITKILKDNGFKVKGGRLMRESVLEEKTQRLVFDTPSKASKAEKSAKRLNLRTDSESQGGNYYVAATGDNKDISKWVKMCESTDNYGKSIRRVQAKKTRDSLTPSEKDKLAKLHALMKKQRKTGNYKMESTDLEEKYAVKYTHPTDKKSGRTTGPMSKAAADKKAAMGNRVDKVGGKYTVIRHVGESIDESTMADRRVLKAVRIAKDMAGNHTGATRAIEKLKKGLSNHPKVRDALRTHNESVRIDLEESVISTIKRIIGMVKNPKATKAAFKLYRDAWDDVVVGALKQPDMDSAVNKIDKAAIILAGIKKGEPVNSNPEYRRRKSRMLKGLADQMAKKGQEADAKKIRTLAKMSESVRSADKKPQNYRDPETGRTMTRMVPVNRDIVAKKANESDDKGRKDPYRPGAVGKDAQKRAHKSFQDVRQMASDMIRKKNMKESVELEERTNSVKYSRKDFENTKKGDKLEIKWGDSISSGRSATFVVAGKSASKKYNVEKLRLEPEGKKGGVKFFLRSRNGGDATFSIGDMAAIMTSIKKV